MALPFNQAYSSLNPRPRRRADSWLGPGGAGSFVPYEPMPYPTVTGFIDEPGRVPGTPGWPVYRPPGSLGASTATTIPPPSGPGTTATPGTTAGIPDYGSIIANDPILSQLRSELGSQRAIDASQRAASLRRALIGFGEVPDLPGDVAGDVDPQTRELAAQNTTAGISLKARLGQAHEDLVRQITNALAARGILRSGETGFRQGRENLRFTQQSFDARQNLLDYVGGLQAAFAEHEAQRSRDLAAGIGQAGQRAVQMYPPVPGGAGVGTPISGAGWASGIGGQGDWTIPGAGDLPLPLPVEPSLVPSNLTQPYTGGGVVIDTITGPIRVFPGDFKTSVARQALAQQGRII